eukprot:1783950-Rhodomonas_salina.1
MAWGKAVLLAESNASKHDSGTLCTRNALDFAAREHTDADTQTHRHRKRESERERERKSRPRGGEAERRGEREEEAAMWGRREEEEQGRRLVRRQLGGGGAGGARRRRGGLSGGEARRRAVRPQKRQCGSQKWKNCCHKSPMCRHKWGHVGMRSSTVARIAINASVEVTAHASIGTRSVHVSLADRNLSITSINVSIDSPNHDSTTASRVGKLDRMSLQIEKPAREGATRIEFALPALSGPSTNSIRPQMSVPGVAYTAKSITRNHIAVQNVLRLRFLVFDFGLYCTRRAIA